MINYKNEHVYTHSNGDQLRYIMNIFLNSYDCKRLPLPQFSQLDPEKANVFRGHQKSPTRNSWQGKLKDPEGPTKMGNLWRLI